MFSPGDLRVLRGEIISDVSNWRFPDNREPFLLELISKTIYHAIPLRIENLRYEYEELHGFAKTG
jgi:hypothetical protein